MRFDVSPSESSTTIEQNTSSSLKKVTDSNDSVEEYYSPNSSPADEEATTHKSPKISLDISKTNSSCSSTGSPAHRRSYKG